MCTLMLTFLVSFSYAYYAEPPIKQMNKQGPSPRPRDSYLDLGLELKKIIRK